METKEQILMEILGKFPGIQVEVPLKLAIDAAYDAGIKEGSKNDELIGWKASAIKSTRELDTKTKQYSKLLSESDLAKQSVDKFITDIKKIATMR